MKVSRGNRKSLMGTDVCSTQVELQVDKTHIFGHGNGEPWRLIGDHTKTCRICMYAYYKEYFTTG